MTDTIAPMPIAIPVSPPTTSDIPLEGAAEPEYSSETLYIQNLNEKIKITGM